MRSKSCVKMKSFAACIFLFVSGLSLAVRDPNKNMDDFLRGKAYARAACSLQAQKAIVPDFAMKFQLQFKVFGKVKGKAEFLNGKVEGLDRARRLSKCVTREKTELPGSESNKTISCSIGFTNLTVKYEGKLKLGFVPEKKIKGEAKVSDTRFNIVIEVGKKRPVVRCLTYVKKGTVKVEFSGLGIYSWFKRLRKRLEGGYNKHVLAAFDSMAKKLKNAINKEGLRKNPRRSRFRN